MWQKPLQEWSGAGFCRFRQRELAFPELQGRLVGESSRKKYTRLTPTLGYSPIGSADIPDSLSATRFLKLGLTKFVAERARTFN